MHAELSGRMTGADTEAAPRTVIRYEHPLNERVRTLMRLEDLFARAHFFSARDEAPDHHAALASLFEITDVAARADLKTDLLQELERQKQVLTPLKSNPQIDSTALDLLLSEIDEVGARLLAQAGKVGQHLRDNEWLMAIKQRTALPGGVSEFDLPAYHYWLNQPAGARRNDLAAWIEPFEPIRAGLAIVLRLLRENGRVSRHVAYHGVFQLMLTTSKVAQLLRLTLPRAIPSVPEISANKYALNIRFIGVTGMNRGRVDESDIEFELTFCNL
jgi:cell division protein ZapD